jgi:hypothetical protein
MATGTRLRRLGLLLAASVGAGVIYAVVRGWPGALYAIALLFLALAFAYRLGRQHGVGEPLPVRPWNKKARRIEALEGQLENAVAELIERGQTIEHLRLQAEHDRLERKALQEALESQLAALESRLRDHQLELASFERELESLPLLAA